jgi:PAS domain S-box-containing protein
MIRQNKSCLKLFGVTDPELANGRYNILKDEIVQHQPYYADIVAVFKEGKIARFEVLDYNVADLKHVSLSSGRQVSLVTTIFPVKDEQGRVLSAVIQHEDITERRKAEEALLYQHKVTQTITRNTTSSLFMMNQDGHCTYLNPAAEKMFGFTQEEMGRQPLHYLIHHHHPDGTFYPIEECPIDRALPQNFDIRAHEDVFFRKDGSSLTVSCAASPIFENGIPVATVVEVRDITEEKGAQERLLRINEDLNRKNEELKRTNIDLDNFVYTASHDLKAPIANLEGIISMMARKLTGKLDQQEMKLIDMMNAMTARLKSTIRDLTEITKVQKELDQEKEAISFEEILEDVKTDIQPLIVESKALLTTDFEVREISYARKNLRSVLYNLVVNALKYHSPERQALISVQTRRQEEFVVLSVQDNGLGIPANQIHKLFAMFRRLHTHVEGSGIGLYITRRIIENNGGRIEVESEENQGTTFRVYFRTE